MNEPIRSPRNTAAGDPLEAMMTLRPGGIEAQEARGQAELVNSEVLPTEILHCTQADLEALGFVFGELVEGDPIFRHATLPAGWSRAATGHSMWSDINDERGIARVKVFYKAAFYDRSAHMSVSNPGFAAVTQWIYGDDASPALHPALNESELRDALAGAEQHLQQAAEHPDIHGDRVPRAESLAAAVSERLATL